MHAFDKQLCTCMINVILQCPYCHKDDSLEESTSDKQFCLDLTTASGYRLKSTHQYYYQVKIDKCTLSCTVLQYSMHLCNKDSTEFLILPVGTVPAPMH